MNLKCFQFYAELISDVSVYYLYTYKVNNCLPKVDNWSNHVSQYCKLSRLKSTARVKHDKYRLKIFCAIKVDKLKSLKQI